LLRLGTVRLRHANGVRSLQFTPDGKRLLSVGNDSRVCLWDVATGKQERLLFQGPPRKPIFARLSPNGKILAVGGHGADSSIALFDFTNDQVLRTINKDGPRFEAAVFSADGKLLAASMPGSCSIWDAATGRLLHSLGAHGSALAFSPNGKQLVTAGWSVSPGGIPGMSLWEIDTEKELRLVDDADAEAVAFSRDGRFVLSADFDGAVRYWDAATGKVAHQLRPASAKKEAAPVALASLALSPKGDMLAAGDRAHAIHWWDAAARKELRVLQGHTSRPVALAFSADGAALASGDQGGTIRLWDVVRGSERLACDNLEGPVHVALSPDGSLAATASHDGIRLWDTASGAKHFRIAGATGPVQDVAFSPDARTLAGHDYDGRVRLWDVATRKPGRALEDSRSPTSRARYQRALFSPDGKRLVCGDTVGNVVLVWDTASGKLLQRLPIGLPFASVAVAPDGKLLGAGSDRDLALWDIATRTKTNELRWPERRPHDSLFTALACSPRGHVVATALLADYLKRLPEKQVDLRDTAGNQLHHLQGPHDFVFCLTFSPDGQWLASASYDGRVRIWEVATGQQIHLLAGHVGAVSSAAFFPDGRRCITGGDDGTALIWSLNPKSAATKAAPKEMWTVRKLWGDLSGGDAVKAYRAGWALTERTDEALPLLKEMMPPVSVEELKKLEQLLADLGSPRFAVRDKAMRALAQHAEETEHFLEHALRSSLTVEQRRRVGQLLERRVQAPLSRARLQEMRAFAVLARISTPRARAVLEALAQGHPHAWRTREARAVLQRLPRPPK
jgi:WD40 repeat protein